MAGRAQIAWPNSREGDDTMKQTNKCGIDIVDVERNVEFVRNLRELFRLPSMAGVKELRYFGDRHIDDDGEEFNSESSVSVMMAMFEGNYSLVFIYDNRDKWVKRGDLGDWTEWDEETKHGKYVISVSGESSFLENLGWREFINQRPFEHALIYFDMVNVRELFDYSVFSHDDEDEEEPPYSREKVEEIFDGFEEFLVKHKQ